jgi:transposase
MNSKEIFSIALNLEAPWYIKDIRMSKAESKLQGQVDIYIDFYRGSQFKDKNGKECKIHDTVERTWQHLNMFEHLCYIHARVPRIITTETKAETVQVPWARKGSGFTLLYEAFSMLLIESEMPVKKAANILGIYDMRLWRIFNYWVNKAVESDSQQLVSAIGIDETSIKKGHNYITIAVDMITKRTIFVTKGKNAECIENLQKHLSKKGCTPEQIKQASIDMSPAFIAGIIKNFPNAQITFDKFHVTKIINEAMDSLRQAERKEIVELKGYKYLFLKKDKDLREDEKASKYYFLTSYPKLGEAYRLKELFKDFWEIKSEEEASSYLAYWCDLVYESGIKPFMKAANTIKSHWSGIINYIKSRMNNGILEGINSKIQLAKRRARGFRNINNFINMIYFITGKLNFDYPLYLR